MNKFSKPQNGVCEYPNCQRQAQYALFQLRDDFTKKWLNLCPDHDKQVARESTALRRLYPDATFTEIK